MSDAKENEEAGKNVPPAVVPAEAGEPRNMHVEALENNSSQAGEETLNAGQNGQTSAGVAGHDDMETENVSDSLETPARNLDDVGPSENEKDLSKDDGDSAAVLDSKDEGGVLHEEKTDGVGDSNPSSTEPNSVEDVVDVKMEDNEKLVTETVGDVDGVVSVNNETNTTPDVVTGDKTNITPDVVTGDAKTENVSSELGTTKTQEVETPHQVETPATKDRGNVSLKDIFLLDEDDEGGESGTEEEQSTFMKELDNFFKEKNMEFKPPKFYGEGLNCLKLWRSVVRLGGYDKVTSCKLWRQVGEAFRPPKTCTTVSWTFRGFYEKTLLEYEKDKIHGGVLEHDTSPAEPLSADNQASGYNRARRDSATRAMQGWFSQRVHTNGEVSDPIMKDKSGKSLQKQKQLKSSGSVKRKKSPFMENPVKSARPKTEIQLRSTLLALYPQRLDVVVVDVGAPADWVKINVLKTKDCFEVYALVPGLLREEVRVQSDPAGRLVISGQPEHPENPWGVTPFKKVVNLPSRIDPHQTSAVVTLHGQLFVRVPFEQSE